MSQAKPTGSPLQRHSLKRLFLLIIDMESLSPFKGLSENNSSCASARRQTSGMFSYYLLCYRLLLLQISNTCLQNEVKVRSKDSFNPGEGPGGGGGGCPPLILDQTEGQLYLNMVNGSASSFSDMPCDNYKL